ncbi:MAG: hypothetical protein J5J00_14780 [Deltaproteobacteria bacterium]|nr:hypothetical protein [Deltaproteobacteria bacterium]
MSSIPKLPPGLKKILSETLSVPTAPFCEGQLAAFIGKRLNRLAGIKLRTDRSGNILATYSSRSGKKLPICFQAHLDHPGFQFIKPLSPGLGLAEGLGGIPENCVRGKLRFFGPDGSSVKATIIKFLRSGSKKWVHIRHRGSIEPGSAGMWDMAPFREKGSWIAGRGFDDNLGAAILLYLLHHASRRRTAWGFQVLFTRAEEVGYVGAIELVRQKSFKLEKSILTVEMPRSAGALVAGNGVVIRAGDSMMDFDPLVSLRLNALARRLSGKSWFKSQRGLGLLGGTESTVFQLEQCKVGSLCLPVKDAHNRHEQSGRPAYEQVHRGDLMSLELMLRTIISEPWDLEQPQQELRKKIHGKQRAWAGKLRKASPRLVSRGEKV